MSDTGFQRGALLLTVLPVIVVLLPLATFFVHSDIETTRDARIAIQKAKLELLAEDLRPLIQAEDRRSLRAAADRVVNSNDAIEGLTLYDSSGSRLLVAESGAPTRPGLALQAIGALLHAVYDRETTELTANIPLHGRDQETSALAGRLSARLRPLSQQADILSRVGKTLLAIVIGLSLTLLVAVVVGVRLAKPLRDISRSITALVEGQPATPLPQNRRGAVGALADAAQTLIDRLKSSREELTTHIENATRKLREDNDRLRGHNRELQQARRQFEAAAEAKALHVAQVSQALRQPLTTIVGFADLLERTSLSREQRDYVLTVQRSAGTLLDSINNMLDWSRVDARRLRRDQIPFQLHECLEDIICMMARDAYPQGLSLQLDIPDEVPARVTGNPVWLEQALRELLDNAIQYGAAGPISLRASMEHGDDRFVMLRFEVSDCGKGLTAEQHERVMEVLSGSRAGTDSGGDSALGISVTRNLTALMGGTLEISTSPNGTTATITVSFIVPAWRGNQSRTADGSRRRIGIGSDGPPPRYVEQSLRRAGHQLEIWNSLGEMSREMQLRDLEARPEILLLFPGDDFSDNQSLGLLLDWCHQHGLPSLLLIPTLSEDRLREASRLGDARALPECIPSESLQLEIESLLRGEESGAGAVGQLSGQHWLVTENSAASRRLLVELLEAEGATVAVATNGLEALDQWMHDRFDVVVMDLRMPELSGEDTTREIRRREGSERKTIIIGMSASVDGVTRSAAISSGMDQIFAKPVNMNELISLARPSQPLTSSSAVGHVEDDLAIADDNGLNALLLEELPLQASELKGAIDAGDSELAAELIHSLHGTAAFYRLESLRRASRKLEAMLKAAAIEEIDPDSLDEAIARLQSTVSEAETDLRSRSGLG